MRAKLVNESSIKPNRELFDKFKKIIIDVVSSETTSPFFEINERLEPFNIQLIDFNKFLTTLEIEEHIEVKRANISPPLGIRLMGLDPSNNQIFIACDESFDDKIMDIPLRFLEIELERLYAVFGHETIHRKQVDKMNAKQDLSLDSRDAYLKNKQEIMALAFSFVEEMLNFHRKEELLQLLKAGKIHHPLFMQYKRLGQEYFKRFIKYVYQYLDDEE